MRRLDPTGFLKGPRETIPEFRAGKTLMDIAIDDGEDGFHADTRLTEFLAGVYRCD
jgi:hypothetical protein